MFVTAEFQRNTSKHQRKADMWENRIIIETAVNDGEDTVYAWRVESHFYSYCTFVNFSWFSCFPSKMILIIWQNIVVLTFPYVMIYWDINSKNYIYILSSCIHWDRIFAQITFEFLTMCDFTNICENFQFDETKKELKSLDMLSILMYQPKYIIYQEFQNM